MEMALLLHRHQVLKVSSKGDEVDGPRSLSRSLWLHNVVPFPHPGLQLKFGLLEHTFPEICRGNQQKSLEAAASPLTPWSFIFAPH